jgi:hypothetical protein
MYSPLELTHCTYPHAENTCPGKKWPGSYAGTLPISGKHFAGVWDKALLAKEFELLWAYRKRNNNVLLHFSEIGATKDLGDDVRAAYLGDLISILAANDVGFTCHEWNKNFGIKDAPKTLRACLGG